MGRTEGDVVVLGPSHGVVGRAYWLQTGGWMYPSISIITSLSASQRVPSGRAVAGGLCRQTQTDFLHRLRASRQISAPRGSHFRFHTSALAPLASIHDVVLRADHQ